MLDGDVLHTNLCRQLGGVLQVVHSFFLLHLCFCCATYVRTFHRYPSSLFHERSLVAAGVKHRHVCTVVAVNLVLVSCSLKNYCCSCCLRSAGAGAPISAGAAVPKILQRQRQNANRAEKRGLTYAGPQGVPPKELLYHCCPAKNGQRAGACYRRSC